jgi:hypothetical protein
MIMRREDWEQCVKEGKMVVVQREEVAVDLRQEMHRGNGSGKRKMNGAGTESDGAAGAKDGAAKKPRTALDPTAGLGGLGDYDSGESGSEVEDEEDDHVMQAGASGDEEEEGEGDGEGADGVDLALEEGILEDHDAALDQDTDNNGLANDDEHDDDDE